MIFFSFWQFFPSHDKIVFIQNHKSLSYFNFTPKKSQRGIVAKLLIKLGETFDYSVANFANLWEIVMKFAAT